VILVKLVSSSTRRATPNASLAKLAVPVEEVLARLVRFATREPTAMCWALAIAKIARLEKLSM
jgi:hypothetical protein